MIKLLTFTSLYPNAAQQVNGIFVENRLRELVSSGQVEATVVAPAPWFPFRHETFGAYAKFAQVPRKEERHGLTVFHPRYPVVPKIGTSIAPFLMYRALKPVIARMLRNGFDFDLLDAHFFYPDGVAAVMLARAFGKPVSVTARGTDLNLIPESALPRRQIQWAAKRADGLITVCQALKDKLVDLGTAEERVTVLRNGVDLERFRPMDRDAARTELSVDGRALASVGLLIERKGHHLVIEALARLPGVTLLICGDGPERGNLEALARRLDVADRVRFMGQVPHETLKTVYAACDALVLASSREGWANVLLEAMACGTPAIASNVWGTGEVVAAPEAGILMADRTADALVSAAHDLFSAMPDRAATRRYAEGFSWDATTQGQLDLFNRILGRDTA